MNLRSSHFLVGLFLRDLGVLRGLTAFDILRVMPVKAIQLGQVWRNDQDGSSYLVTRLYNEVLSQIAVLRHADANAAKSDTIRVKVQKTSEGATLPGYTYTQDAQDF
jgi:hypothetical protein